MSALPRTEAPADAADHSQARLARQPIVDRNRSLVGFELLYIGANGIPPPNGLGARWTAELVADLFTGVGVETVLGNFTGYVNVDAEFLGSEMCEVLPPSRIRLELGDSVSSTAEMLRRCQALKKMGYGLVVDNYWGERERVAALLPYVEAVKVDLDWVGIEQLAAVARPFAGRTRLIAEKVESAEQFQLALAQGFDLFQGYHFALPERLEGRRANVDMTALLRLINLIVTDAELDTIEEEFKRQPAMAVGLLKLANSAAAGMRTPASTLREAVMRLGRRPLQTWLQLMVYTARGSGASPLLHTAALRGKLMELVALKARPDDRAFADRALMVGLLSLMHVVFGRPQSDFVTELKLPDDLRSALHGRAGPLGSLLRVVESREGAAAGAVVRMPAADAEVINRLELEAFKWASEVAMPGAK